MTMNQVNSNLHLPYLPPTQQMESTISTGFHSPNRTPASASSSNNTYLLPISPSKRPRETYKPKVIRTVGQKPACLVNASVTYCGNDQVYAFGGFDQYTDEVYNHVLKLDLKSLQWSLVDNYGDIPGVRMGHTATIWQGAKLLVFGGENEHREYLSDLFILDLESAHWTQPEIRGSPPKGRARHAATVHDDKLYVTGGLAGTEAYTLDEICYLDLKTWTWSRSWRFVGRFDHTTWVWGGRIWVFGGLGPDMERTGDLWWLDLSSSPAFKTVPQQGISDNPHFPGRSTGPRSPIAQFNQPQQIITGSSGYTANSSSVQRRASSNSRYASHAPGAIASMRFTGPNVPSPSQGTHFQVFSSGALLDFVTPAGTMRPSDCNLSALELEVFQWQKLAEGPEIFDPNYRWHYCAVNEDGTKAWLLGCATDSPDNGNSAFEEYLSDVLPLDLKRFGLLGNELAAEPTFTTSKIRRSETGSPAKPGSLAADIASMFDKPPEAGSGADFIITGERDIDEDEEISASYSDDSAPGSSSNTPKSASIHVHRIILQARWPHFNRLYTAQMAEFHTKKMHIPEPYAVVRAFLYYLYTDSISASLPYFHDLREVAGLLVMASVYDMSRLRQLCVHRLSRELDIEYAALIWERAGTANEDWLKRRAAKFCLTHWGRVVRTDGFRMLSRRHMMELCEVIDVEGRVVGGEELEMVGGLGGGKFGFEGQNRDRWRGRAGMHGGQTGDEAEDIDDADVDDDEGMDVN